MNKELEALGLLSTLFDENNDEMNEAYEVLEKALTPPTEEEMCKVLSERTKKQIQYQEGDFIYYTDGRKYNCISISTFCEDYIWIHHSLPPHILMMVVRFYENLKEQE